MSHMSTLRKVMDQVHQISENHSDRFIKKDDISFDSLEKVNVDGVYHPLRPMAQQCISNRLGIPIQYLRKCPPEIQRLNMNYWIEKEKNDKLFFRFDKEEVRAVFTPRYIPTDNLEVLERLKSLNFPQDDPVQYSLDDTFMMVNIPDTKKSFTINGDRMTPGVSVSNSEVGIASLSISAFVLRLVCTNGMISKTEVTASYRHISAKILSEFPQVLNGISNELENQKHQISISLQSKVDNPESTIERFNRQFQVDKVEKEAVDWGWTFEAGDTMFNIINTYTRASQYDLLSADSSYKLQKIGGNILAMLN